MNTFYLFAYTAALALTLPMLFPLWHILYFAPFIIVTFYRSTLNGSLWWSLLCGFIIDLYSADTRMGTYALNYCLTTFVLFQYKMHLFEKKFYTLFMMTFCFTILSTIVQTVIFLIIGKLFSLSLYWAVNDLIILPFQAGIYAVIAFAIPLHFIAQLKRRFALYRLTKRRY